MKCFGLLFAASALVAASAWGSETPQATPSVNNEIQAMLESLGPLLTPSPQLIAFEKQFTESLLNFLTPFGTPEQAQRLRTLTETSLQSRKELLKLYNRMKEIQQKIDGGVSGEEEAELRKEMRTLLDAYHALMEKRKTDAMDSGAISTEELKDILELPVIKEMESSIASFILKPFEKYT